MTNEVYLAVVYRPTSGVATSVVSKVLARAQRDRSRLDLADALDACEKLVQTLTASLARYEPDLLGTYRSGHVWCSSLLEYLGLLINGEWQRSPLPSGPLSHALATTRLFFGTEAIEYRSATATRVGAMLGIKEYPTPSVVGMYNRLLSAPFAFVLTQSFSFLTKASGQALLQRQCNRMANAGDFAVSQASELKEALDALTSNEFVMGDHHFSLQVLTDVTEFGADAGGGRLKALNDHIALARSVLADTGMLVAREDLALEAAFWAQLPGNFPVRPRKAPITSRNFAAMAPFHNYPTGRATENHWGDALSLFVTSARSPYYFSLHASDPTDPDGGSRKDTGHTLICGPTGSGKTVFIGFLIAMLDRQGVTQVVFDKDRGLEILVRALGGEYLPLKNGVATGFNPLQLPSTPANVEFPQGVAAKLERGAVTTAPCRSRARIGGSGAGAARNSGSGAGGAAPVPAGGISRSDGSGRTARAPRALVRSVPRGLRLGVRQLPGHRGAAIDGSLGHRLRRDGISRPFTDAAADHPVFVSSGAPASRWPSTRMLDG